MPVRYENKKSLLLFFAIKNYEGQSYHYNRRFIRDW